MVADSAEATFSMDEEVLKQPTLLAPPAVTALREEAAGKPPSRVLMERTISQDIRDEREDLKEAAEHSLNVIVDLGLDGRIRWVSPSWEQVIGTPPDSVQGKEIADFLIGNSNIFAETVEAMKKDDSRSQTIRFQVRMGPSSVLRPVPSVESPDASPRTMGDDHILSLEAQGIMVYDRTSGGESHVSIIYQIRLPTSFFLSYMLRQCGCFDHRWSGR